MVIESILFLRILVLTEAWFLISEPSEEETQDDFYITIVTSKYTSHLNLQNKIYIYIILKNYLLLCLYGRPHKNRVRLHNSHNRKIKFQVRNGIKQIKEYC